MKVALNVLAWWAYAVAVTVLAWIAKVLPTRVFGFRISARVIGCLMWLRVPTSTAKDPPQRRRGVTPPSSNVGIRLR